MIVITSGSLPGLTLGISPHFENIFTFDNPPSGQRLATNQFNKVTCTCS
jgi:hypothetical protein